MTVPYAMVGGGPDSGVGALHRNAARQAGLTLVAGCFSRDAQRNQASGRALGLRPDRVAATVHALVEAESARADGARLLVVCTPHVDHAQALALAIERRWRTVVEKPLCATADELDALTSLRLALGPLAGEVTLPLVMRYMPGLQRLRADLRAGAIGTLRWMTLEYLQGRARHGPDDWRFRRRSAGPAGTLADLGPHAWDLCHWLSGSEPSLRAADIRTLNPDHELDDSAWVWLDLGADARAQITLCQAATGLPSQCSIRLFGSLGVREWQLGNEARLAGGIDGLYQLAFERFYDDVARWCRGAAGPGGGSMPGWHDGARGVRLAQACLSPSATQRIAAPGYGQTINEVS